VKVGDIITVLGPNNADERKTVAITGVARVIEPLALVTRSGCHTTVEQYEFPQAPRRFFLRPEDEGRTWIYGDDEAQIAALIVAEALWERTQRIEHPMRRAYSTNQASTRRGKT
jgi:hypothetical protein